MEDSNNGKWIKNIGICLDKCRGDISLKFVHLLVLFAYWVYMLL